MRLPALLLALFAIGLLVSACTANTQPAQQNSNPDQQAPSSATPGTDQQAPNSGGRGYYNNLTPEQRQQAFTTMMQQSAAACDGKAENDSCTVESPRGNRTGTCQIQNSTLRCNTRTGMRQPQ